MIDLQSLKPGDRVFKRAVQFEQAKYPVHEYEVDYIRQGWVWFESVDTRPRKYSVSLPLASLPRWQEGIDKHWFHSRKEAEASIQAERERKIARAEKAIERALQRLEALSFPKEAS